MPAPAEGEPPDPPAALLRAGLARLIAEAGLEVATGEPAGSILLRALPGDALGLPSQLRDGFEAEVAVFGATIVVCLRSGTSPETAAVVEQLLGVWEVWTLFDPGHRPGATPSTPHRTAEVPLSGDEAQA